ncbi:hypothetical protein OC845_003498 [Tilletia horrida]|nr:hypothetical protein OC845_003498 [Tilletia horrida]
MSASAAAAATAESTVMLTNETVFRAYAGGKIATFSKPFNRFGVIPIGGRTTVVKLQNEPNVDALFVVPSTPLADAKEKVKELAGNGPGVRFLAAPDVVHSMYLQEWSAAFPDALVLGVDGLQAKNPDIKSWYGIYGRDSPAQTEAYQFEPEIKAVYFPTFGNKDVVFFHAPTKTLITADLIFNFPLKEQYANTPARKPTSWIPFLNSVSGALNPFKSMHQSFLWGQGAMAPIPDNDPNDGVKLSKAGGSAHERKQHFARAASKVAGWDIGRLIMCHGEVIEDKQPGEEGLAKRAWISAFGKYLNPDGSVKV